MTFSDILDGAFKLYRANLGVLLAVTAIIVGPLQVLSSILFVAGSGLDLSGGSGLSGAASGGGIIAVGLVSLLAIPFVAGVVSRIVAASYLGQEATMSEALRSTLSRFPSLLGAWFVVHLIEGSVAIILGAIGVAAVLTQQNGLGAVAFIGATLGGAAFALAAMALLQATAPAIVVEELGPIQGVRRSIRLMSPRFFPVLGIAVLSGLMAQVIDNIVGGLPVALSFALPSVVAWIPAALGSTIASMITAPFIAIVATLVYFDGRIRHEGFDLEVMASDLAGRPR